MNHIKQITPITIRDIDFTVSRQIEQCPKTMMLRELVNAIEAAAKGPVGRRMVEIKGKTVAERAGIMAAFAETRTLICPIPRRSRLAADFWDRLYRSLSIRYGNEQGL